MGMFLTVFFTLLNFSIYYFAKSKKYYAFIPIVSYGLFFLYPFSKTPFIFSALVPIILAFFFYRSKRQTKFTLLFAIAYTLMFLITIQEATSLDKNIANYFQYIFVNILFVLLGYYFIISIEGFYLFIKGLIMILFISYVLLGFYQYFTGEILLPWVDSASIKFYTVEGDMNRLRSFIEIHPANSASGILLVIFLTIYNEFIKNKILNYGIFIISVYSLMLTFTRWSITTFLIIGLIFIYKKGFLKLSLKTIIFVSISVSLFLIILNFTGLIAQSERLSSGNNLAIRWEMWTFFLVNISNFIEGYGFGSFNPFYTSTFENYFLQEFFYFGFLGVLFYTFLVLYIYRNYKLELYSRPVLKNIQQLLVIATLAVFMNIQFITSSSYMFFLLISLSFCFNNLKNKYV